MAKQPLAHLFFIHYFGSGIGLSNNDVLQWLRGGDLSAESDCFSEDFYIQIVSEVLRVESRRRVRVRRGDMDASSGEWMQCYNEYGDVLFPRLRFGICVPTDEDWTEDDPNNGADQEDSLNNTRPRTR